MDFFSRTAVEERSDLTTTMGPDDKPAPKKIKFRSISTTTEPFPNYNKVEDINSLRQRSKSEQKYKRKDRLEGSEGRYCSVRSDFCHNVYYIK